MIRVNLIEVIIVILIDVKVDDWFTYLDIKYILFENKFLHSRKIRNF
jgi:hypothetical protein